MELCGPAQQPTPEVAPVRDHPCAEPESATTHSEASNRQMVDTAMRSFQLKGTETAAAQGTDAVTLIQLEDTWCALGCQDEAEYKDSDALLGTW
ncbi:hypothetical protein NDU88_004327 [Pleurodeles waltl]|uniref:Uncharacterized protein n=1 Tax=Pleurodeles waltl TaxID=8319 RepID=A0AAV7WW84_PLEWA|nr:hypothetical protein NDU88_004327 [Pleurodeles waltl]